jgi:hypothetical protein
MAHATPKTQSKDRIKLPFTFDADKMLGEFEALKLQSFEYYNVIPLRAPAHTIDTSLPTPAPADDYADGSWCDWLDTEYLETSPYLKSVVETFKEHTKVTLVRLLRLAPNSVVQQHTDPTLGLEVHKSIIRLTVPIFNKEGVQFFLNDSEVSMLPGECWYLRLTDPHRVINNSSEERINLTIDMIPNNWIRNIISESER